MLAHLRSFALALACVWMLAAPQPLSAEIQILEEIPVALAWSGHPVRIAIETAGARQYVAFYDADRRMKVAARNLNSNIWTFKELPSKLGWDSHNGVVLAVDGAGTVHVAGNMHGDPLVYFRSAKPHDISTLQRSRMLGSEERAVTYPVFLIDPQGRLYFHYRHGRSSDGVQLVNRWNPTEGRWTRVTDQPLLDGQGHANAYVSGPVTGPDGRFHMVWVWRDSPSGATNHDISYARSQDLAHWQTAAGESLALPLTPHTASAVVDPVPSGGGLAGIAFGVGWDGARRPVVNYVKYDEDGRSQQHNARWEQDGWRIYRTSDWSWRWDLEATGSKGHAIVAEPVRIDMNNRLVQRFRHLHEGEGIWVLDPVTLRSLQTLPWPRIMTELRQPESRFPGMEVREFAWDRQGNYLLRWETLPYNRDRRRSGQLPPATMLKVLRLTHH